MDSRVPGPVLVVASVLTLAVVVMAISDHFSAQASQFSRSPIDLRRTFNFCVEVPLAGAGSQSVTLDSTHQTNPLHTLPTPPGGDWVLTDLLVSTDAEFSASDRVLVGIQTSGGGVAIVYLVLDAENPQVSLHATTGLFRGEEPIIVFVNSSVTTAHEVVVSVNGFDQN